MALTSTEKSAARDIRQKAMGRLGRKVWATIEEHDLIHALLLKVRGENPGLDWNPCGESEHLTAEGNKGEWVILVGNKISLSHPRQPYLDFDTVEEAQAFAESEDAKL